MEKSIYKFMKKIFKVIKRVFKNFHVRLFLFKYYIFRKKNKKSVNFLGYKLVIDNFLSFYYEVKYIFKDEIYHFDTKKITPFIIDGGVCMGTSLLYFKKLYPNCKIIGFEPSQNAFKMAQKNVDINKLRDITLINVGLYNSNGKINFSDNEIDSGKIDISGNNSIEVVKLSGYINEEVDFLKLNIEGAEYEVLVDLSQSGKIKMIKEMCFEWHSFSGQKQNLDEVLKILRDNDFKYYISSLSTERFGRFSISSSTQYYLMIYAKKI